MWLVLRWRLAADIALGCGERKQEASQVKNTKGQILDYLFTQLKCNSMSAKGNTSIPLQCHYNFFERCNKAHYGKSVYSQKTPPAYLTLHSVLEEKVCVS